MGQDAASKAQACISTRPLAAILFNEMTSLEKILAYQNLKAFLDKQDWKELGEKLNINTEDLRRTWGKNVEDSFFLIVQLYDKVEDIIVFSEGVSKLTNTPSADGLIILKNGDKLLVEVKASKESEWKISKGRFDRQKELAHKIGINLYYAIFLNGHWGLFTTDFIESKGCKIEFPTDWKFSVFESMFDSHLVRIPKGLQVIKYYSPDAKENSLSLKEEPDYGYLFKYIIRYDKVLIPLTKQFQLVLFSAIDEALIEGSIKSGPKIESIAPRTKKITHECNEDIITNDFNLVMEPIHRTINSTTNDYYDSSSFILNTLDKLQEIGKPKLIEIKDEALKFLNQMRQDGIPFLLLKSGILQN